jgi:hypothetical protein
LSNRKIFYGTSLHPALSVRIEFSILFIAGPGTTVYAATPGYGGLVYRRWECQDFIGDNDGVLQNGATFAPGEVGMAFSLNGTNHFVSLPANVIPYPTMVSASAAPISVDAWFLTTTGGVILGQQGGVSPPAVPTGAISAIYVGTDGHLYVELFWKGTLAPISSLSKVNDGVFHHVAVTFDGTTETVYLDGALIASTPFVQTGYASSYQYQIGTGYTAAGWPATNGGYFYFQGLIDEVEFFNRALSQAEIQAIVNAGKSGKCKVPPPAACAPLPSGIVDWYTADGNANDSIGKNNGTLQNAQRSPPAKSERRSA